MPKEQMKQAAQCLLPHEVEVFERALRKPFLFTLAHKFSSNSQGENTKIPSIDWATDGDCH
jgi:hypothetical protein